MRRTAAVVFAGLALIFYGIGVALLPDPIDPGGRMAEVGLAPAAALILFLMAGILPRLEGAARLISALWPPVTCALLCQMDGAAAGYLTGFGFWPFVAAAVAAGLALVPTQMRQLPTLALLPFGAVVALALVAALAVLLPRVARLLGATPYHFVITLALATTLVALADAATTALSPARERLIRSLAGMMPLLGFLGTIAGLIEALGRLPGLFAPGGAQEGALTAVIAGLSTAFETTLVGLVGAAACSFLLILLVDREARAA